LNKTYKELIDNVTNPVFNSKLFIDELFESVQLILEKKKIEERSRKHKIKLQAEKEVYGKEKNIRKSFSNDEKDEIFAHFNNECVICATTEGLHIHHKDKNPSNNQMKNLIVLCGVCHKKVHMNVR
jgi:5-methylcytosine-specific restriction endonuclease McrA